MLKISFNLSSCLGFVNLNSQTKKLLAVQTFLYTVNTVQKLLYIQEPSKQDTCQGREPM